MNVYGINPKHMSLAKKFLKSKPVCKVTFQIPAEQVSGASKVNLLGEFTDWKENALNMRKLKDGSFTRTVDLEVGKEYAFRYLVDETVWHNDAEADAYQPTNVSMEENSVVVCS